MSDGGSDAWSDGEFDCVLSDGTNLEAWGAEGLSFDLPSAGKDTFSKGKDSFEGVSIETGWTDSVFLGKPVGNTCVARPTRPLKQLKRAPIENGENY